MISQLPLSNLTASASSIPSYFPTIKVLISWFWGVTAHPTMSRTQVATQQLWFVAEISTREKVFSCCALTPSEALGDKNTFFRETEKSGSQKKKQASPTHWLNCGELPWQSPLFCFFFLLSHKYTGVKMLKKFRFTPSAAVKQFSFFLCAGQVAQTAGVSAQLSKLSISLTHTHTQGDTDTHL